jgi:hypothetical protein
MFVIKISREIFSTTAVFEESKTLLLVLTQLCLSDPSVRRDESLKTLKNIFNFQITLCDTTLWLGKLSRVTVVCVFQLELCAFVTILLDRLHTTVCVSLWNSVTVCMRPQYYHHYIAVSLQRPAWDWLYITSARDRLSWGVSLLSCPCDHYSPGNRHDVTSTPTKANNFWLLLDMSVGY